MDASEYAKMVALVFGMSVAVQIGIGLIIVNFVGLKQLPEKRALTTSIISFIACLALGLSAFPQEYGFWIPLAILPAAFVSYLYWRRMFRKAWYDDASQIPDGMTASNDDWRAGLWLVAITIIALVARKLPLFMGLNGAGQ